VCFLMLICGCVSGSGVAIACVVIIPFVVLWSVKHKCVQ